jgi:hypothetical protein
LRTQGFRARGSEFREPDVGFRFSLWDLGFRVSEVRGSEVQEVQDLGLMVQGSGLRAQGSGIRA